MLIDEQVDHGAIVAQKDFYINTEVGFYRLQDICAKEGAELLAEILPDWIKGKIKPQIQDDSKATFTKKIEKKDGLIDMNDDPYKNYLKILAYEEWPKAFFKINKNGKEMRVVITSAEWKDNKLEILKVIPEGKKEMSYGDFLRGNK